MTNGITTLLSLLVGVLMAGGCDGADAAKAQTAKPEAGQEKAMVRVKVIGADGKLSPVVEVPKLVLSDAEWQKRLTKEQYRILRNKGTEAAFCGTLLDNKKDGIYVCAGCSLPLFDSGHKFNSGTGWPSFFRPVADENVTEVVDKSHGMVRTEILCTRCDGHLGHVFDDGPPPTGKRHCMNSESLRFVERDQLKTVAEDVKAPATRPAAQASGNRAEAVFAGGCFWCVEAVFEELSGVIDAVSGYAGGDAATANYEAVGRGNTGHAEVVRIIYDPSKISYEKLLQVHFATHDPTTLNRQGNDVGPQYRSAIFYASEAEKELAKAFIDDLNEGKAYRSAVVTTLEPLKQFFPAERYHQNYVCDNPRQGYVQAVAMPKVEKVREKFKGLLKEKSPLKE